MESTEAEEPTEMRIEITNETAEDEAGNARISPSEPTQHNSGPGYQPDPALNGSEDEGEDDDPLPSPGSRSMCRVPRDLFEMDERAYTPRVVSIGPIHRNEPSLKSMEAQKQRLLRSLLARLGDRDHPYLTKEMLEKDMEQLEIKTRECYPDGFDHIGSSEFVEMMILDGCFILELMRLCDKRQDVDDAIFETRSTLSHVRRDLLKLENQLPMFVLQKLFDLTISDDDRDTPLITLAVRLFQPLKLGREDLVTEISALQGHHEHLLALFHHSSFVPSNNPTKRRGSKQPRRRNKKTQNNIIIQGKTWVSKATYLRHSGVLFRSKPGKLLDMEFRGGVLKIPTLFIDESRVTVLKNLLAYEQCHGNSKPYFTSLAVFISNLACVPQDIPLLRGAGIIQHEPCDDEAIVNILNPLCRYIEYDADDCCMAEQLQDIDRYCQQWFIRLRRWFQDVIQRNRVNASEMYLGIVSLVQKIILRGLTGQGWFT